MQKVSNFVTDSSGSIYRKYNNCIHLEGDTCTVWAGSMEANETFLLLICNEAIKSFNMTRQMLTASWG